jgi:CheY-like chemotaxis protein
MLMSLASITPVPSHDAKVTDQLSASKENLIATLKGKRFGLVGFEREESDALRSAIDFANAYMHAITPDLHKPALNSMAPFDACVVNLSSAAANVEGGPVELLPISRKPTIIIGDRDSVLRHAFLLASSRHQFIIRPWTREDFFLRAFLVLRVAEGTIVEQPTRGTLVRTEPTIIVADDDRTTVMMVQSILRTWKINCVVAQNGKDAIALTRKLKPDALLLDVSMPDMDGFQVLGALRADPTTRAIPIMMLTAAQSESEIVRGFDLGVDDYLTKPFRAHELLARLKRLVRNRTAD